MKSNFQIITAVLLASTLLSCKKHTESDPNVFTVNSIPATSDAKLLLILNDDVLGNTDNAKFVKITTGDNVVPISISNTQGGEVTDRFKAYQLSNASPDFMLATFSRGGGGIASEGYLINKSTGNLIQIDQGGLPLASNSNSLNFPFTYYNGSSYIYTIAKEHYTNDYLVRISTANPNAVSATRVSSDTIREIDGFEIDADNNILSDMTSVNGKRFLLASNSNKATIIQNKGNRSFWLNSNGDLSFNGFDGYIKKVTSDVSGAFTISNDVNLAANNLNPQLYRDQSYRVAYNGTFVMIFNSKIYELDNAAHKPKEITTVPVTKQVWIDHSQSKGLIFIAGENASGQQTIFRVDLANNYAYTTYPAAGKYSFYEIEAFEDGTVYATAKRNSDGKSVILKFAPDGTETLLDDTMNHRGVWLEKVTEFTNN